MDPKMKILSIYFVFMAVFFSSAVAGEEYSPTMNAYFRKISFIDGNSIEKVELYFKLNGPRYNYILYHDSEKKYGSIEFGDLLVINAGESIRLATRGSSLSILNLKKLDESQRAYFDDAAVVNGWYIESQVDLRSFGQGLKVVSFYVVVNPSTDLRANLTSKYENKVGYIVFDKSDLLIVERNK